MIGMGWGCVGPRWCGAALGCEVIEEGLPGRTAQFDDPIMGAHMNGQAGLKIALESHGPLDVLVLMLGTNDVKARFTSTPEAVVGGIASLLDIAQHRVMQERHGGFKVLLICPTPVVEVGPIKDEFWGGAARSQALPPMYAALAKARGMWSSGCGSGDQGQPVGWRAFRSGANMPSWPKRWLQSCAG